MRHALLALFALPLATLPAQRPDATFEWQKRATAITYGAVPVGKHHLGELAIGQTWRLGNNLASTWQVEMPLLVGDAWIAPGQYRVSFVRVGETQGALLADGSGKALDGADARVGGEITEAGKESKKLAIEWQKEGKPTDGNQTARVVVQFGPTQWRGEVLALGHKEHKVTGAKLMAFHVPAERVEQGAVPVATLARGKDAETTWNLVLSGTTARLVPWMQAPTEQFGFGAVTAPEVAAEGTVTVRDEAAEGEQATFAVREAKLQKDELRVVAAYGKKTIEIVVPMPKAPK